MTEKHSFWSTLPGILTGLTGLISAIGGLLLVLNQMDFLSDKSDVEKAASNGQVPTKNTLAKKDGVYGSLTDEDALLPREIFIKEAEKAMDFAFEKWIQSSEEIRQLGRNLNVTDMEYLVSGDLGLLDLPAVVAGYIEGRKKAIREIILTLASALEEKEYGQVTIDKGRFKSAAHAVRKIHRTNISMRSFKYAVIAMRDLSILLYRQASDASSSNDKLIKYIEYNAYVYEICSISLELLNELSVYAKYDIIELSERSRREIDHLNKKIKETVDLSQTSFNTGTIKLSEHKQNKIIYRKNWEALDFLLHRWDRIIKLISAQEGWIREAKMQKIYLEIKKRQASEQLELLKIARVIRDAQNHFSDVAEISQLVYDIPILPVNKNVADVLTKSYGTELRNLIVVANL